MKNILIIGDSWGVPNYYKEFKVPPEAHTQFLLSKLGYKVFNFSINGGSMLDTIEYARTVVSKDHKNLTDSLKYKVRDFAIPNYKGEKIDWIVWFHTESIREQIPSEMLSWTKLEELHIFNSHLAYRAFIDLIKLCKNPKTVVIGGQAPIDPILYQYLKPDFQIVDWRSELVGRKLPGCISLSCTDLVNSLYDSTAEKLVTLEIHKEILDAMSDTNIFFDRCHPGPKPHAELTEWLDKVFKGEVAQTVRAMDS